MNYTDLEVWKEARYLVKTVYDIARKFPADERFGLTSQIQRAAISVPSNIAEGCGREGIKDSIRFFHIARGSLFEIETQIYLALDLEFINKDDLEIGTNKVQHVRKLLSGFIKYYTTLL